MKIKKDLPHIKMSKLLMKEKNVLIATTLMRM